MAFDSDYTIYTCTCTPVARCVIRRRFFQESLELYLNLRVGDSRQQTGDWTVSQEGGIKPRQKQMGTNTHHLRRGAVRQSDDRVVGVQVQDGHGAVRVCDGMENSWGVLHILLVHNTGL